MVDHSLTEDTCDGISLYRSSACTLRNNTCSSNYGFGIIFYNSSSCIAEGNTCSKNGAGIWLRDSHNCTIQYNTCRSNRDRGIYIWDSNNCTIEENSCPSNDDYGIFLYFSDNCTLVGNTFQWNNDYGVYLYGSSNCTITGNTISENGIGIYLRSSSRNNIAHYNTICNNADYAINTTDNEGFFINATNNWWGDNTGPYHPTNNSEGKGGSVSDYVLFVPWFWKPNTWYVDDNALSNGSGSLDNPFNRIQKAIDHSEDGDTIRVFEGTYHENIRVYKSVNLIGNGSQVTTIDGGRDVDIVLIAADWVNLSCFLVWDSRGDRLNNGIMVNSDNSKIFDNIFSNNNNGIYLLDSNNCTISKNICSANRENGIYLDRTKNCTLEKNSVSSNDKAGIRFYDSGDCTIMNNTCSGNKDYGIYIWDSSNVTILNSLCSLNSDSGIYLRYSRKCTITNNECRQNSRNGIILDSTSDSTIEDNICSSNNEVGIRFWDSSDSILLNNTISDNEVGIFLEFRSKDNSAHENNIHNNIESGMDASVNNGFNINATNNWWGDKTGPYHPTLNPNGSGNAVSDYVLFEPWKGNEGPSVTGTIWFVDDDALSNGDGTIGNPFNTIQDAIDNATNGDRIRVFEGTYYENVIVERSVSLIGNGSDVTTIDSGGEKVMW